MNTTFGSASASDETYSSIKLHLMESTKDSFHAFCPLDGGAN